MCLIFQTPKATLDIKELRVDISKDGGSEAGLFVKLQLFPITVHIGESRVASDQPVVSGGSSSANRLPDGVCPPFSCEEFSVLCELGHNRYALQLLRSGFAEIFWFISNSGLVLYLDNFMSGEEYACIVFYVRHGSSFGSSFVPLLHLLEPSIKQHLV